MVSLVSSLTTESVIKVKGKLLESPKVKLNGMEIIPESIEVLSLSENEIPFNFKKIEGVIGVEREGIMHTC